MNGAHHSALRGRWQLHVVTILRSLRMNLSRIEISNIDRSALALIRCEDEDAV
jgi:hypothetical protein